MAKSITIYNEAKSILTAFIYAKSNDKYLNLSVEQSKPLAIIHCELMKLKGFDNNYWNDVIESIENDKF